MDALLLLAATAVSYGIPGTWHTQIVSDTSVFFIIFICLFQFMLLLVLLYQSTTTRNPLLPFLTCGTHKLYVDSENSQLRSTAEYQVPPVPRRQRR